MTDFTLIVPYYRQPGMLMHQLMAWEKWPAGVPIIVVDDGSKEPAWSVIMSHATIGLRRRITLLRIDVDIPWNRGGARNLGTTEAKTDWIVHVDIDHVMTAATAEQLVTWKADPAKWYRFERYRVGQADETRKKDAIAPDVTHGKIHPHIDSYLTTRAHYWDAGGYDEDYSGCLGGGTPFTKALAKLRPVEIAPAPMHLNVWTRSACRDSSEATLDRTPGEFTRRRQAKEESGNTKPKNPLRFKWHREEI